MTTCPESKMDDGSHSTDLEDGGSCAWCGASDPARWLATESAAALKHGKGETPEMAKTAHSLAVMTYGSGPCHYNWRCACGDSGHGEAPTGSSKEDIAERAWHDHDAGRSVSPGKAE